MSERREPALRDGKKRFDREGVRRILERAAAEQYRLEKELAETYSLEELQEMAAEAGISREALRIAIERRHRYPDVSTIGVAERPRRRAAFLQRRWLGTWSPLAKGAVLVGTIGVALVGAVLAFPVVAQALFWATIVLSVLILLGASPF
jgi:hypothetical protein